MIWSNVIIHIIDCSFDFDTKVSLNLDLISYLDLILVTDLVVYSYLLDVLDPIENLDLFNNLDIVGYSWCLRSRSTSSRSRSIPSWSRYI